MQVNAYAAFSPTDPLGPTTISRRALNPLDVLIEIKFCGICHSDISHVTQEWWQEQYPMVPGHEIAGVVVEVGSDVTRHKVGDRVGVGCLVDACRECRSCRAGEESYCIKGATQTYAGVDKFGERTHGGYSTHIVVVEDFVFKIPEGLELDVAAPLLCAGITLYAPLKRYGAGPGKRVGIIGLGGLGHMGVKIAKAMGAEVVVFSQTSKKREDATRLGASEYVATAEDPECFKRLASSIDVIVNTITAPFDIGAYLSLLGLGGTMVNVGAPLQPMEFSLVPLLTNRRQFAGSLIAGNEETQEMLDFCAKHGIGAEVEVIPVQKVNEAYARIMKSDVRYRFVIDIASLK